MTGKEGFRHECLRPRPSPRRPWARLTSRLLRRSPDQGFPIQGCPALLDTYGWSDALQRLFLDHAARGLIPGRVTVQQRGHYRLVTEVGEVAGELSGKFHFEAEAAGYPVAGDWVACT